MTTDKQHGPNVPLYLGIFGALIFLTVLTVLVSYWHLPKAPALLIALAIAGFKASLVAAFFMHLKGEKIVIFFFLGLTMIGVLLLFTLPFTDSIATRGRRIPFEWNDAEHEAHVP